MNGKRAKSIRKYIASKFPFLSKQATYLGRPDGTVVLHLMSSRRLYQTIKRNFYRKRRGMSLIGVPDFDSVIRRQAVQAEAVVV